jgi:hypothetical protein
MITMPAHQFFALCRSIFYPLIGIQSPVPLILRVTSAVMGHLRPVTTEDIIIGMVASSTSGIGFGTVLSLLCGL